MLRPKPAATRQLFSGSSSAKLVPLSDEPIQGGAGLPNGNAEVALTVPVFRRQSIALSIACLNNPTGITICFHGFESAARVGNVRVKLATPRIPGSEVMKHLPAAGIQCSFGGRNVSLRAKRINLDLDLFIADGPFDGSVTVNHAAVGLHRFVDGLLSRPRFKNNSATCSRNDRDESFSHDPDNRRQTS